MNLETLCIKKPIRVGYTILLSQISKSKIVMETSLMTFTSLPSYINESTKHTLENRILKQTQSP